MRAIRFTAAVFMVLALCAPAPAANADELTALRPHPAHGPVATVRSVYKRDGHVLSFTGLTSQGGPMAVAIDYSGPGGPAKGIVVSTHRFKDYQASLGSFFSDVDSDFLASVRRGQPEAIAELTKKPFDGSPRSRAAAQLALVEIGALAVAKPISRTLSLEDTPDCRTIAVWALNAGARCALWEFSALPCLVALSRAMNISLADAQDCIDTIMKLICESQGPNYRFVPADPNTPGSYSDCYECVGTNCVVVATTDDSGGGGGSPDGGEPFNQIPDSGTGNSDGFGFYSSGGGVTVCSTILLPDGQVIIHCN